MYLIFKKTVHIIEHDKDLQGDRDEKNSKLYDTASSILITKFLESLN